MDYWIEDSNWRSLGSQQGMDDWDFYRMIFGGCFAGDHFEDGDPAVDSHLKNLRSFKHPQSHFRIQQTLNYTQWRSITNILSYVDVSRIEHLELELPQPQYPREGFIGDGLYLLEDFIHLTFRRLTFGRLKTLRIRLTSKDGHAAVLEREEIQAFALEDWLGTCPDLHTLSLPACIDIGKMSWHLEPTFSRLRSFSITGANGLHQHRWLPILYDFLALGCFRKLEHLDLSDGFLDDASCWNSFIPSLTVRNVPGLKSLRLSENVGVNLADMVPFLLSSPLENLVLDGCEIDSVDVERFTDAIRKGARNPLALRRLDLHNNELDDIAVHALAGSDKLAQLQDLDLSMNSGIVSGTLLTLMETFQRGHHPSLKVLIWARNPDSDAPATEAFVRLYAGNDANLPDEWYQVLYRFPKVTGATGLSETKETQCRVQRIQSNDMREHVVDWHRDPAHCLPASGSGTIPGVELSLTSGARCGMDHFETILESNRISTVEALRLRITSLRSQDPAVLAQGREGNARLAAALMTGQFTSLLTRSLSAGGVIVPIISLSAFDLSGVLGSWNEKHISHVRAFSILSMEGLDDLSRTILHQKLDSALKSGFLRSLQHLELSSGVLDGVDGWEVFTRAINSGNLDCITSVHVRKNVSAEVGPFLMFDFHRSLMVMDGCWVNSEQVWGLADALINGPGTRFSLKEVQLCNGVLVNEHHGWKVLTRAIKSGNLDSITSVIVRKNGLAEVGPVHTFDFPRGLIVMDGSWVNSEQVWGLADALINGPGTRFSLKEVQLCNGVLDNEHGWKVLTRAIKSGNLDSITSVIVRKNGLAEVGPVHTFDFPRGLIVMDGCWVNSEQVWSLADALINRLGTMFSPVELHLCNGVLDDGHGWKVLTQAIESGKLGNIRSLRLSQNALNRTSLEDLLPILLTDSFVKLVMDGCFINTDQLRALADVLVNCGGPALALESLDLSDNLLSNQAVDALVNLADSYLLLHLKVLNLGRNVGVGLRDFKSLTETIERGRLPSLETLIWLGNPVDDVAAKAVARAYYENEDLTTTFDITWNQVSDPALWTMVNESRARNIRLRALKVEHKDVLEDVTPLTSAKVFLCGFPEVGKTTLRRALTNSTRPLKEARTRGIELSQLEERNLTLTLWDIAGQEEYRVLHGTFFADLGLVGGKATIFILVLRASFAKSAKDVEKDLLYWFRFIASSSQKHVKRHVVIVLNCFGGQQCAKPAMTLWMSLIKNIKDLFRDVLHIRLAPFVLDVRFPTSVQPLKDFLFGQAQTLLENVMVPKVCLELQKELKRWAEDDTKSHLPIMSWEAFEKNVNLKRKENRLSGTHFKAAALYLHEIGGIVYFDHKESTDSRSKHRSVVVLHPEWFCRQVVGELLLPDGMLEHCCSLIVNVDGLIPTYLFQSYFEHLLVEGVRSDDVLSMLERVGLCYRKGNDEIMVPALIQKEDHNLRMGWEGEGCGLVIGRCLAIEDHERTAIPMTLFRRLQVELAQDTNFGGRGDSGYRAGKFSSSFNVGELSFLIEVDANPSNPNDDRIDILVKTVCPHEKRFAQVERVCEIMQKLQVLCFACCPGLRYDVKVIEPWSATEKAPEMTKRRLMSLRGIKVLVLQDELYSSWRVNGNAVELKTFLADVEMKAVVEIKAGMKAETDDGTRDAYASEWEIEGADDYYNSDFSEGSEDSEVSLGGVEANEKPDVSSEAVEDAERAAELKDDIKGCWKEDSLPQIKDFEEGNSSNPLLLENGGACVQDRQVLHPEIQELKDLIRYTCSHLGKVVHREGHAIRQHIDDGNQKLLLNVDEGRDEVLLWIQAHYSFSIAEKEKSVPRFLILKRKDSSGLWTSFKDTVKGPFRKNYRLHFLCECQFDDGNLHWVEDQEGVKLSKTTDVNQWLKDVEPWVRWSYFVATTVAKIALTVLLPGTAGAIPTISTSTEEHDRARDTAVRMLQDEDEKNGHGKPDPAEQLTGLKERLIAEGHGNVGTSDKLTDVKMKLVAEGVVKDLIVDIGLGNFVKGTKLRRVVLKASPQIDSSRRSRAADSVSWVCEKCLEKYGAEATAISP